MIENCVAPGHKTSLLRERIALLIIWEEDLLSDDRLEENNCEIRVNEKLVMQKMHHFISLQNTTTIHQSPRIALFVCRDRLVGGAEEQEQEEFGKVSGGAAGCEASRLMELVLWCSNERFGLQSS